MTTKDLKTLRTDIRRRWDKYGFYSVLTLRDGWLYREDVPTPSQAQIAEDFAAVCDGRVTVEDLAHFAGVPA